MLIRCEKGIALLTILIMLVLGAVLVAGIVRHQHQTLENTGYFMRQNQSLLYAKSAELFFSKLLAYDAQNSAEVDYSGEIWAQPMPPFAVEDGTISGYLQDQSGKFNLNSLLNSDGKVNVSARAWFEELLERVGLPRDLSQSVIDWQDADDEPSGPMGAERSYYQGLTPAYLPANQPFLSAEELKQVRGFEGKNFDLIRPYVVALPGKEPVQVNINSASPILLASLDKSLNVQAIEDMLERRQSELRPFRSVDELWAEPAFEGLAAEKKNAFGPLLGVKSNYFKAYIQVVLSDRTRQFSSELYRKSTQVNVYARHLQPF